jgi:hypothetical protein
MASNVSLQNTLISHFTGFWRTLYEYLIAGARRREAPIVDRDGLKRFVQTRSSYIAQTSLYGYLRTRSGMRYPELFDDDPFVASINIAKWHMFLACLSDLSVYTGGLLRLRVQDTPVDVEAFMQDVVRSILDETGLPEDAGPEYSAHAERVMARVRASAWRDMSDDESVFTESPAGLVKYAPIVDELKQLDDEIVRNSVRFHWQEIRRDLRDLLDAEAVLASKGVAEGTR